MTALARIKFVIVGWAAATVFFTAVLEISELGHKPLGFALYANAVHFALWALTLPIFARCIRRFPLKEPEWRPVALRICMRLSLRRAAQVDVASSAK